MNLAPRLGGFGEFAFGQQRRFLRPHTNADPDRDRIVFIAEEDRVIALLAEPRLIAFGFESRMFSVLAEPPRLIEIEDESRTVTPALEES